MVPCPILKKPHFLTESRPVGYWSNESMTSPYVEHVKGIFGKESDYAITAHLIDSYNLNIRKSNEP